MRTELCLAVAVLAGACSGKDAPKDPPKPSIRLDAGVAPTRVPGPTVDPATLHIDEDMGDRVVASPAGNRQARDIEITLRSTPPGARVSVDGAPLGTTPAFCNCKADGREHEFLFIKPGHGIARYRFVPVSSGVIHARLEPIAEESDAGVPPPEVMPPQPTMVTPNAPQPTMVTPTAPQPAPLAPSLAPSPVVPAPVDGGASGPLPPPSGPQP